MKQFEPQTLMEFLESFHDTLPNDFTPWWMRRKYEESDTDEDTDD